MRPTHLLRAATTVTTSYSLFTRMASQPPTCEGVFAINKPPSLSSAQVIRDAQTAFQSSKLFAPWFAAETKRLDDASHNQKQKRRGWKSRQKMQVKMGHGGTLDPMATGVLILGVGNGTKALNTFLECTKSYETVVLFGAATDSYDAVGKVVARKGYEHVTREGVEKALEGFRGKIMQKPSIFSALKVNGKKMYEYAREGKELPQAIEARPVEVKELEVVEWMEGGTHEWQWPEEEAEGKEKEVVRKALEVDDAGPGAKRKREGGDEEVVGISPASPKRAKASPESKESREPTMSGALPSKQPHFHPPPPSSGTTEPCPAPAVRLRMTVTSGFYVRSLAHDLGMAVDSLGLMSSLVRTRQGEFELGSNVLDYDDLAKDEEVWGPKVEKMLKEWEEKHGRENTMIHDENAGAKKGGREEKDSGRTEKEVRKGVEKPSPKQTEKMVKQWEEKNLNVERSAPKQTEKTVRMSEEKSGEDKRSWRKRGQRRNTSSPESEGGG